MRSRARSQVRVHAARLATALLLTTLATACGGSDGADDAASTGPGSADAPASPDTPTATERPRRPRATPTPRDPLAELVEELDVGRDEPVLGADISWPQCPVGMGIPEKRTLGMPMPVDDARYVVVGLTNGPGFHPNPCLADQVQWVRERGLMISAYAVASWPSAAELAEHGDDGPFEDTEAGRLANVGYQQARFNVASMRRADFPTPIVWIDVEPVPSFDWSPDLEANAAVVTGLARGYRDAGYRIGVYSTPALWEGVVGDLELGVPEWRAAGQTSREEALERCGDDWVIQGGEAVLGQWVQDSRDMNVTCPGVSVDLEAWFHRF